jgi:hypothetical protein
MLDPVCLLLMSTVFVVGVVQECEDVDDCEMRANNTSVSNTRLGRGKYFGSVWRAAQVG